MKSEWTALGLSKPILQTLKELKFSKMTPVQVQKNPRSIFYCIFKFECKDKEDLDSQPDKTVVTNRISDSLHSGMKFILHNFKEDFRVLMTYIINSSQY